MVLLFSPGEIVLALSEASPIKNKSVKLIYFSRSLFFFHFKIFPGWNMNSIANINSTGFTLLGPYLILYFVVRKENSSVITVTAVYSVYTLSGRKARMLGVPGSTPSRETRICGTHFRCASAA